MILTARSYSDGFGVRRDLAVDMGLAMLVFVVVGTAITANVGDPSGRPGPAAYGFSALFGALMLVRRRWPVATLLVTAIALLVYYRLDYPPIGLAVPVSAALFSAAELGKPRWAVGVATALLLVSVGVRVLEGDNLAYVLGFELASSAGLMAAMIALGDSFRARRGWRAELDRRAREAALEREREASRRVEQERVRIARELHDLMAHTVSVVSLHTDVARESMRDDPETAERSLVAARQACGKVVHELRATVRALRTAEHDASDDAAAPGIERLDELVRSATDAGLDVQVRRTGEVSRLPAVARATAYRVIQESVSNVIRHSGARTVTVEVHHEGQELRLRIQDDGVGRVLDPPTEPDSGWGIIGMRERVGLLGGDLQAAPHPDGGFVVEARIPAHGYMPGEGSA